MTPHVVRRYGPLGPQPTYLFYLQMPKAINQVVRIHEIQEEGELIPAGSGIEINLRQLITHNVEHFTTHIQCNFVNPPYNGEVDQFSHEKKKVEKCSSERRQHAVIRLRNMVVRERCLEIEKDLYAEDELLEFPMEYQEL